MLSSKKKQSQREKGVSTSTDSQILLKHGLRSAAIFYEHKNEPLMRRASRVTRACMEETPLPAYNGTRLYPLGKWNPFLPNDDPHEHGLAIAFTGRYTYKREAFAQLVQSIDDEFEQLILQRIARDMNVYTTDPGPARYFHAGHHWIMNYPRILNEGLEGYMARLIDHESKAENEEKRVFYAALRDTLEGLITVTRRGVDYLKSLPSQNGAGNLERLIKGLERVPIQPARNFYEALLSAHFITQFGCLEPGRIDKYLYPYYTKDLTEGRITPAEAKELLDEFLGNIDSILGSPTAVHMTLGGTDEEGRAAYNELTEIILKSMRQHRQPNTSLRVRKDMPDELWETVLDNLAAGCGNPALVNEELYLEGLRETFSVSKEDMADYAFGGCTETLIQGRSAVDATWVAYNVLDVLEQSIQSHLIDSDSYEEFLEKFKSDIRFTVREMVDHVNLRQHHYASFRTEPIRALFTEDCIEQGKGFNEGGARYNFDNTNIYGMTNAINSLYTLSELYSGELEMSRQEFMDMLQNNYEGFEKEHMLIRRLDKFGNDTNEINALATEISTLVFDEILKYRCYRGDGQFMPAVIGWVSFVKLGWHTGASPDGRKKGEPLADSTGPMQGTDKKGLTAMLLSTAAIPQNKAVGTCVLNVLLDKKCLEAPEQRERTRALFQTYFNQGGAQIQVNVVSAEILEDAMKHPEKHENLVVRVAGYSDYFVKQREGIKEAILERTRHEFSE
ncbi:glycyl radical enzyme domain-containing protein [Candidatus Hydrogenedentota bacterium]